MTALAQATLLAASTRHFAFAAKALAQCRTPPTPRISYTSTPKSVTEQRMMGGFLMQHFRTWVELAEGELRWLAFGDRAILGSFHKLVALVTIRGHLQPAQRPRSPQPCITVIRRRPGREKSIIR